MDRNLILYEKVIPLAHLGIWERNLVTGEIYWNQVAREIYETGDDFHPTLDQTFSFYTDQDALKSLFDKAIASEEPERGEFRLCTAKGNLKWIKLRLQAGHRDGERIVYGTIKDISNQRNILDTLAEREEQFHHAFEYAPIGMALVATDGKWIRVNKNLCEMLGYKKEHFMQKTFQDITHPDDLDLDLHQMHALLDGKTPSYSMEKRYYHANGSIIWALLSVTLVRDKENAPLYFVSQIKDITERKKMEIERDNALKIINAQNSRLLNFAHIISHNLRSHAGNIKMLTDMIAEENDHAERENLISLLGINSVNLMETLEHLNDAVDIRSGKNHELKTLNLLREIKKIRNVLTVSLHQINAELIIDVDPEIEISVDQAYLESILLNLLTNCIKYRKTDIPLSIRISANAEKNKAVLEITDNGIGIDLSVYGDKLFGMYNTFHGNEDAHGIGLFLVKNQVESMGGTIGVRSSPGNGATFIVIFPIQRFIA
ncbi:sensor histidine kinase [Mucilaginibacter jinjuensis]|uniref:histidine kinase n=1 Tax=Mucilaginibacter jinjuensis TaxID=1176721 RepID=A0ABY7TBN0_9SPHI|nr:PAS domain S-box protein [Mucilaginibacter jinjuensis]WCT13371.1 PAS domain S-box protein [Mucilaginibacter jinjuensis]